MALDFKALQRDCKAAQRVFRHAHPACALVLGSGWSQVTDTFEQERTLAFGHIPSLGYSRVPGHPGRVVLARTGSMEILIFEGRRHWYEGEGWTPVAFPIRLAASLGVRIVILTNAAGGIRPALRPGTLMAIDDHINMMGANPLVGPHDTSWGPRFPDQREVYDSGLRQQLHRTARRIGEKLAHGIYMAVSGPTYETPAEIAAFRSMGADAVGMSTVPEAILAHAAGLRVVALSCISNLAATAARPTLSHDALLREARKMQPRMTALLSAFIHDIATLDPL